MPYPSDKLVCYMLLVNPQKGEYGLVQMIPWRRKFKVPKEGERLTIPRPEFKGKKFVVLKVYKRKSSWADGKKRLELNINVRAI